MKTAIEQIADVYIRLNNRRALEDLRMHRQRLAIDLKLRTGYDFSSPIGQIEDEIAVIEAGLERLNRPLAARNRHAEMNRRQVFDPARSIGQPRPDARLTTTDSGQPFPGSVAGIPDRWLFLLAPRTCERARQVPLHLPFDTSRRTKISPSQRDTRQMRPFRARDKRRPHELQKCQRKTDPELPRPLQSF